MLKYIVRRVLIFIPTLFAISLFAFVISINAPGDPVENLYEGAKNGNGAAAISESMIRGKEQLRRELGLDLPVFYFTFTSLSEPDTIYKIRDKGEREALSRMLDRFGNWPQIEQWYVCLNQLRQATGVSVTTDSIFRATYTQDSVLAVSDQCSQKIASLFRTDSPEEIVSKLDFLKRETERISKFGQNNFLAPIMDPLKKCFAAFADVQANSSVWKTYVPSLHFYGYNQYHRWLFGDGNWITGAGSTHCEGIIRGDFGISYSTRKKVTETIARALPWSMLFTIVSILFAYLISIPLGVQAAAKRGSLFDRSSSIILFMLYSLPTFFMGTLLILTFANPDVFSVLPANGVKPATGYPLDATLWGKFKITWPYMILPLICYTYSSLAFLSRTMRVAMLEITSQDYIRTAKAKGLSYYLVIYKHGLRNALLPIITVFANIFPLAVGGSVILEFLFGIPGMGPEILTAVQTKDYPMIVAVFTLSGFMTLVGYLVADILYAFADPRISYSSK